MQHLRSSKRTVIGSLRLPMTAALALAALVGCSGGKPDVRTVRQAVIEASGKGWKPQFRVGVGPLSLGLLRATLCFTGIDPEAAAALQALHAADVSLDRRFKHVPQAPSATWLSKADARLQPLGWQRTITVVERDHTVLVYFPTAERPTKDLEVCVVVLEPDQLIVASARSDLQPLLDLAWRHSGELAIAR